MTHASSIEHFLSLRRLAVAGVSRSGKGFGCAVFRHLVTRGLEVFPVNPHAGSIDGATFVSSLADLAGRVEGVVLVTPPAETERLVADAFRAGIMHVWMQQGAESPTAVRFCQEHGVSVVHGECIMMFSAPGEFPHSVHRFFRRLTGGLPAVAPPARP